MRFAIAALMLYPAAVLADSFTIASAPTAVTVFPIGAEITREVQIDLPAGAHDITLPDVPRWMDPALITATLSGARIDSVSHRDDPAPRSTQADTPQVAEARAALRAAEAELAAHEDKIAAAQIVIDAARAQMDFLTGLGTSETLPADVETLRALAQMIGDQSQASKLSAQQASIEIRALTLESEDLQENVERAENALDALLTADDDFARLVIAATVAQAGTQTLTVHYRIDEAYWQPVYNARLTTGDAPSLVLERGANVEQGTGEDWTDVALTLSTVRPSGQSAPSEVQSRVRRIEEPAKPVANLSASRVQSELADSAAPIIEAPVIVEDRSIATANQDGPFVRYEFPTPVTVANRADTLRIALDEVTFDAETFARAVPLEDETAFRMARFTNTSGEQLLGGTMTSFVDGQMTGQSRMAPVAAGQDATVAFGAIETLRLSRVRLDRNEGDRGIITRSNQITEDVRIDIENLGPTDWQVEVVDRIPVSEQEDLSIEWSAAPAPNETSYKDRKGVLLWTLDVAGQSTTSISLKTEVSWPEGMILR